MLRKSSPSRDESRIKTQDTPAVSTGLKPSGQRTIIGEHISIEGDIRGTEDLLIEGSVKGSISLKSHHLTVGPKGKVEAEIDADNVTISGLLVGNIKAKGKVQITREADFTGEIKARRISVEDGAFLKAAIELEREAEKKPTPLNARQTSTTESKVGLTGDSSKGS